MNNKMAVNTYLSTTESKKLSKQAEQNRQRDWFDGCQMARRFGE